MIVLKGCKSDHVSREQIRAFLYATLMILSYHNRAPALPLVVTIKRRMEDMGNCWGSRIDLRSDMQPEEVLTTCVHEVIHACITFPVGRVEKCTTTLCSKIKPDVLRIADILLEGTYRRAAYIAHTKIHYPPKGDDFYDPNEDIPVGVVTRYGGKALQSGSDESKKNPMRRTTTLFIGNRNRIRCYQQNTSIILSWRHKGKTVKRVCQTLTEAAQIVRATFNTPTITYT